MKELTIEEKAQRYDEAIERANSLLSSNQLGNAWIYKLLPELKESEGEKIRKWLIALIKSNEYGSISNVGEMPCPKLNVLDWLEKQGEQKPYGQRQECVDCQFNYAGECKGSCAMKRGKQKPDKIEPKFKVGDIIKPKDDGNEPWQIMQVDMFDKKYRFKDGYVIHFSQEDDYELVEQKAAWSEEDETVLNNLIYTLANDRIGNDMDEYVSWLKSLKDKYTWKPSKEQKNSK